MTSRLVWALCAAVIVGALAGCASEPTPEPATPPAQEQPPTSELRLAPGLYDMEGDTVQGLGTVEYSDLEGGFWLLTDGTLAEGAEGKTIAVIANWAEFESELKELEGKMVTVTGKRLEGASIRMAGPEIEITSIEEITDTPGIAE